MPETAGMDQSTIYISPLLHPSANQSSMLIFDLVSGVGGVRVSVRVGSDPLCHMSKPETGYHRWHQHRHLCVGDGNLQGEGQVTYAQTGENTNTRINCSSETQYKVLEQHFKTRYLILKSTRQTKK